MKHSIKWHKDILNNLNLRISREQSSNTAVVNKAKFLAEQIAEARIFGLRSFDSKKFLVEKTPHATLQDVNEWIGRVGAQRGTIEDLQHL